MPKFEYTSLLAPHRKVTGEQLTTEEGILALGANLRSLNRRRFLSRMAATGAVAAIGGMLGNTAAGAQTAAAPSIVDVLNFALNLEFLEAQFYIAASGYPALTSDLTGGTGSITNVPQVKLTGNELNVAANLAQDEVNHITQLRTAINSMSGTPITQPDIDFSAGGTMPPITTDVAFFAAARQFTAVGNSAYAGSASALVSNPAVLGTAGQILGAEAQHLGVVNYICAVLGIKPPSGGGPDKPVDALDVPPSGDYTGLFTITSPTNPTDAAPNNVNAAGIARSPNQVLGIVYGVATATTITPPAGVAKGGFFPNGVNGTVQST